MEQDLLTVDSSFLAYFRFCSATEYDLGWVGEYKIFHNSLRFPGWSNNNNLIINGFRMICKTE